MGHIQGDSGDGRHSYLRLVLQPKPWARSALHSSVQLFIRVQLCDSMDCNMPGLPVRPQLLELAHTHVHQVGDAIQSSHSLSSPPAFNLFQNQGLFQ